MIPLFVITLPANVCETKAMTKKERLRLHEANQQNSESEKHIAFTRFLFGMWKCSLSDLAPIQMRVNTRKIYKGGFPRRENHE